MLQALETGKFGGDVVGADADEVDAVVAVLVGDGVVRVQSLGVSTAVILAPAMAFPLESETVPTSDVVVAIWAYAALRSAKKQAKRVKSRFILNPLLVELTLSGCRLCERIPDSGAEFNWRGAYAIKRCYGT